MVFILHSQGGIEGGLIIDWLLAESGYLFHFKISRLPVPKFLKIIYVASKFIRSVMLQTTSTILLVQRPRPMSAVKPKTPRALNAHSERLDILNIMLTGATMSVRLAF